MSDPQDVAEALDADKVHPSEPGRDAFRREALGDYPPDAPLGATSYGNTATEQAIDEPLYRRVEREEPDVMPDPVLPDPDVVPDPGVTGEDGASGRSVVAEDDLTTEELLDRLDVAVPDEDPEQDGDELARAVHAATADALEDTTAVDELVLGSRADLRLVRDGEGQSASSGRAETGAPPGPDPWTEGSATFDPTTLSLPGEGGDGTDRAFVLVDDATGFDDGAEDLEPDSVARTAGLDGVGESELSAEEAAIHLTPAPPMGPEHDDYY